MLVHNVRPYISACNNSFVACTDKDMVEQTHLNAFHFDVACGRYCSVIQCIVNWHLDNEEVFSYCEPGINLSYYGHCLIVNVMVRLTDNDVHIN